MHPFYIIYQTTAYTSNPTQTRKKQVRAQLRCPYLESTSGFQKPLMMERSSNYIGILLRIKGIFLNEGCFEALGMIMTIAITITFTLPMTVTITLAIPTPHLPHPTSSSCWRLRRRLGRRLRRQGRGRLGRLRFGLLGLLSRNSDLPWTTRTIIFVGSLHKKLCRNSMEFEGADPKRWHLTLMVTRAPVATTSADGNPAFRLQTSASCSGYSLD